MTAARNEPKIWLITGASQGMGLALSLAALHRGHKVLATARQVNKARMDHPDLEKLGGIWIELDVSKQDTQSRVDAAVREHGAGKIDVVVNNAGFNLIGTVENLSEEDMMLSIQTHFMGPFRVIKAVLPYMRAQNSGTIVFHGSCLGMRPFPAGVGYCSVRAASDMMQQVLRLETTTFNIRCLNINSGLFISGILANGKMANDSIDPTYLTEGSLLTACMPYVMKAQTEPLSMMRGDPEKWSERVLDVVDKSGEYGVALADSNRLLLGEDAVILADQHIARYQKEVDLCREIAATTDLEGTKASGMAYLVDVAPS